MSKLRKILIDHAEECPDDTVALLMSGGIDSASVLFSLMHANKHVVCYTFIMDGIVSSDFSAARQITKIFNVDFVPIILPKSVEQLKNDLLLLASLGAEKKTDFECMWPIIHSMQSISQRYIFSGIFADGHFGVTKRAIMHFKHRLDEYRKNVFGHPESGQLPLYEALGKMYGKNPVMPYASQEMQDIFLGTSWDEINRPNQKQWILDAFPDEFSKFKPRKRSNMHLGDSGISEHFEILLKTDWNLDGWKSSKGIYNALASGRIK